MANSREFLPQTLYTSTCPHAECRTFEIDASGQLKVKAGAEIDFETVQLYDITVETKDSAADALSLEHRLSVSVQDVNEPPTMQATSVKVSECGTAGTQVAGLPLVVDPDKE